MPHKTKRRLRKIKRLRADQRLRPQHGTQLKIARRRRREMLRAMYASESRHLTKLIAIYQDGVIHERTKKLLIPSNKYRAAILRKTHAALVKRAEALH